MYVPHCLHNDHNTLLMQFGATCNFQYFVLCTVVILIEMEIDWYWEFGWIHQFCFMFSFLNSNFYWAHMMNLSLIKLTVRSVYIDIGGIWGFWALTMRADVVSIKKPDADITPVPIAGTLPPGTPARSVTDQDLTATPIGSRGGSRPVSNTKEREKPAEPQSTSMVTTSFVVGLSYF